ncbi:MAG: hypothetical protein P4L79_12945 [Legionella sp.]|nr:hypothetical protein [Legionella sp.]
MANFFIPCGNSSNQIPQLKDNNLSAICFRVDLNERFKTHNLVKRLQAYLTRCMLDLEDSKSEGIEMDSMIELIGYVASFLVFATFYVKKILTLRLIAISSNVAFILYALGSDLHPIFLLHSLLLPLNLYRIFELKRNTSNLNSANVEAAS